MRTPSFEADGLNAIPPQTVRSVPVTKRDMRHRFNVDDRTSFTFVLYRAFKFDKTHLVMILHLSSLQHEFLFFLSVGVPLACTLAQGLTQKRYLDRSLELRCASWQQALRKSSTVVHGKSIVQLELKQGVEVYSAQP